MTMIQVDHEPRVRLDVQGSREVLLQHVVAQIR